MRKLFLSLLTITLLITTVAIAQDITKVDNMSFILPQSSSNQTIQLKDYIRLRDSLVQDAGRKRVEISDIDRQLATMNATIVQAQAMGIVEEVNTTGE